MRRLLFVLPLVLTIALAPLLAALPVPALAGGLPYDERADAPDEVHRALIEAHAAHKDVLLVFGANWCPDCRALDMALHGKDATAIAERYVVVKVDVGNFDKNLDLARRYQVPLRKGIPAAAVIGDGDKLLHVTTTGELANARNMGDVAIVDFLSNMGGQPAAKP
jgi:thioredoxin 1